MDISLSNKSIALLHFLKDAAALRRKRAATFASTDKVIWFGDIPKDRAECRSALLSGEADESPDIWLEVRKKRMPRRPDVPKTAVDWVRPADLDLLDTEPQLLQEITILVERTSPDPEADPQEGRTIAEKVPELRYLTDHPEVEDAWLEYIVNQWEPWTQEMRRWQEVQRVYEDVDFTRRRLEESEERYELLLTLGLIHWRDSNGTLVKRHLLAAPAEIVLEAARGLLKVVPAASFDGFRIELDMLELQDQPRLEDAGLQEHLEELDIHAWDRSQVGEILREIANRTRPNACVDEDALVPGEHADGTFRVSYAPALVLRERRPTAYEEILSRLSVDNEKDLSTAETEPWKRFLREGEPSGGDDAVPDQSEQHHGPDNSANRVLFPLPTNEEQRQIVDRLCHQPYVLVKGPPGTGKSHTIANLICHLLACGERVLVTAHAAKALTVLRGLLPDDMRDLCVTALGSTREDQRLLEEGVRGILRRQNEWAGGARAQEKILSLEQELHALEDDRGRIETHLRECREAETHAHRLASAYEGTAASIARQLEQEKEAFGWFPEVDESVPFPLKAEDVAFLVGVHVTLTQDRLRELQLDLGDFRIPDPDEFKAILVELEAAEEGERRIVTGASSEKIDRLRDVPSGILEKVRVSLTTLDEHAARAGYVLGRLAVEILSDLMAGVAERWTVLASDVTAILEKMDAACEKLTTARVEIPSEVNHEQTRIDAERRLEHFENGGRRGFWKFTPRTVSQTQYIENRCRVNGRAPRDVESLRVLVTFLQLRSETHVFASIWPGTLRSSDNDPRQVAPEATALASELRQLLDWFQSLGPDCLSCVPANERVALVTQATRDAWSKAIEAEIARRRVRTAGEPLGACLSVIQQCLDGGRAHPCLDRLARAVEERDAAQWQAAWESRRRLQEEKDRFRRYEQLMSMLNQACPGLGRILDDSKGNPEQEARLLRLDRAWAWSSAATWVRHTSDPDGYRDLVRSAHRCQERIEKKTQELAALRSWLAFFGRLDELTAQSLNAWTKAVDRIGKGTGKYAYRHRKTAREYLMACIPKIPGWIMPLHKLWQTVEAEPGLFDTIIIDEASQAGIDSLVLLLLAKRIIVVGDDKQNSPEAVGLLENDIARLVRQHLTQFRFQDEFRPDTSLFDHAERAFGNPISLREHFRCVPEIIRFSNELCYRDAPLIPLRQAPLNRLAPLRHKHVPEGSCEGNGQSIRNRAEAEAVVEAIRSCLQDEAYEGKTMGVIALQGHAQAELIGSMLAKELDPKVIEERRLRCGEPPTFQGDQRDIIFISLVTAPNVRAQPLTGLRYQRRFNVAMSRAKDQVWLFHSVQQPDLSPECLRRRLLAFFQNPIQQALDGLGEDLDHLEREVRYRPRQHGTQPEPYESWFEVDVAIELLRRKYRIRPQYEFAGYRIDIVVEDLVLSNRIAVECDGDAWHGPEQYEKDMARQRQLERGAQLTFVRIRESEFYSDRSACIQQMLDACESLGIRSMDQVETSDEGESMEAPARNGDTPGDNTCSITELPTPEVELAEDDQTDQDGTFAGYSAASGFPNPREGSPANVREALHHIIEKDGPLVRNSVFRLYVEGCPDLQRVGKMVRQTLNYFLGAMLRAGEIVQEEELGPGRPEGQVVRLAGAPKVRERPAGKRDLLEIPASELIVLVDRLRPPASGTGQDHETLLRNLLDHYGFTRLTAARRKYLEKVLKRI